MAQILIIDDEPEMIRLVSHALADHGHHVTHATTGAKAWDQLARAAVDVVVVDRNISGESGLDLCRRLKQRPQPPPVVLLSSEYLPLEALVGAQAPDALVVIPFLRDALLGAIDRVLANRSHVA
jgi:CheY-like chemotaxis protein